MKNHRLIAFSFNVRVLCMQAYFIYILTVWCTQSIQKGIMKKCSTLCRIVIRDSSAGFFFLLIVQFCKHVWHNAEKSICQILLFSSSFLLTSSCLFYPHPFFTFSQNACYGINPRCLSSILTSYDRCTTVNKTSRKSSPLKSLSWEVWT